MLDEITRKEQMLVETILILRSVDWTESEINKQLKMRAIAYNKNDYKEVTRIELIVLNLLKKLKREQVNMANFMTKYRNLIHNEKKEILLNLGKKK